MNSNWSFKKISDVCEVVGGGTPSTKVKYYYGDDIPWITPRDLSNRKQRYIDKGERSISKLGLENSNAKLLPKGSVLFTSRAPIGYVAIAKNELSTNQGFKNLILKPGNDPNFFYYLLKANTKLFESRSSGSTFNEVSGAVFKDTELRIPPKKTQVEIAIILSSLDDKIENNIQINHTLEQMAQAIFKSWFVDFDPVKAKIKVLATGGSADDAEFAAMGVIAAKNPNELTELKQNKPEQYKKLARTAALFPSAMQDSELGKIPKGWTKKNASNIYDIVIGKTPPRKELKWFSINSNDIKWLSIKGMGNRNIYTHHTDECLTSEAISKYKIKVSPANSVFLSFKLTIGRVTIAGEDMTTNEAIAHFRITKSTPSTIWTYLYLKSFDYSNLGNTSSIARAINSKIVKTIPVVMPDDELLCTFDRVASPIFNLIEKLELNSINLSALRNTLLPKLLSGEIKLTDEVTI